MGKESPFSRLTIIAAVNLLGEVLTNNKFDNLMLRFGLEEAVSPGATLPKKVNRLTKLVLDYLDRSLEVPYGGGTMSLQEAIVREAMAAGPRDWFGRYRKAGWGEFCNGLKRDGFTLVEDEASGELSLQRAHPEIADLPAADDEVHTLLRKHDFAVPLGHLDQAIDNHSRGSWAAANSQLRPFLEGLLDEISERLAPEKAQTTQVGHHRRTLLASLDPPFLSKDLGEFQDDGKGLINGLFKRLNPQGNHPGLSDEEDSTFRLHIVLVVARLLLRRYDNYPPFPFESA